MSRVKHPGDKKRLSLSKDHRVFALEGNKTFRKAWRLKKAKASRRLRRAQAKELVAATQDQSAADALPSATSVRSLRKLGVMSLDQTIDFKDGDLSSRWSLSMLGKNKEALRASRQARKPRRR